MSEIIVGIDLGTTNSAVAIVENGQPRILAKGTQKLIPSVVGYSKQAGWLVGRPALNQYSFNPDNTIRSVKRKMGTTENIMLGGKSFTPQQISAFILRELKTIAEENVGQPVGKAVITVPAYFTNAQRWATQEAGEIAGLEVVRIINEPTAAALAYGLNREADQLVLVYDLGGGTFDVSLVEMMGGIVEVRASHGDTQLGGDDFDQILADYSARLFEQKHQYSIKNNRQAMARLIRAAEGAKIYMSDFPEASLREEYLAERNGVPLHLEAVIQRTQFEEMIEELLQRTLLSMERVLDDSEVTTDALERVLLVGGSTRIPLVWDLVAGFTGLEPDTEINPDEAVALGAAVQAAIIAGQPVDSILVDVTPYSLGIEVATEVNRQIIPDLYNILIRRNTTIPVTKEQTFRTLLPQQESVQVKVYQGEQPVASANTLLGDFMITGLKPAQLGDYPSVNVCFDFDVNGMLYVRATDQGSGAQEGIIIKANQARMTPQDIANARKELMGLDIFMEQFAAAGDGEPPDASGAMAQRAIVLDEETQVLLDRAQELLEGGNLSEQQADDLQSLMRNIRSASSLHELDHLAEALLDLLFELE